MTPGKNLARTQLPKVKQITYAGDEEKPFFIFLLDNFT